MESEKRIYDAEDNLKSYLLNWNGKRCPALRRLGSICGLRPSTCQYRVQHAKEISRVAPFDTFLAMCHRIWLGLVDNAPNNESLDSDVIDHSFSAR